MSLTPKAMAAREAAMTDTRASLWRSVFCTSPAQYPASSGVGVSVLLQEACDLGYRILRRGQRRGTVLENAPADYLALPKCERLAEIPDDLDSAARAGRMDFRVEDDVVTCVAEVAVGPAVVFPFLDPATESLRMPSNPRNTPNPSMSTREVSITTSGWNRVIQAANAAARSGGMASASPASPARMAGARSTPCNGSFARRSISTFSWDIARAVSRRMERVSGAGDVGPH